MKLFYRQVGETGMPLIILHGVFGSSDNWLTISKTIAEGGFRLFLLDQRNHGRSPHSDEHDYEVLAADLHEFITDHQLEKPILLGHSMGGKAVMQFAMDYPGQFSKLVVVDIGPQFYPVHHTDILRGFKAIDLASLTSRNDADRIMSQYEPDPAVRQFLLKNLYRDENGSFNWRLNLRAIEREIHGIGEELRHIRTISEPTLVIRGADSGYIREQDIDLIRRIFLDCTLETVEGAGHWVQAEKPKEFVEVLFRFLGVPAGAGDSR
ncbi:alpha/beta fold hydrolase [Larkinella soli]|uniref:alpha/beta fold hydrolase n=1 Tax=Larkinella soli TaxID=1770527 RepID=UPI000FFB9605|nr:alpha/beta fold hydrolase [Larkinella soli]